MLTHRSVTVMACLLITTPTIRVLPKSPTFSGLNVLLALLRRLSLKLWKLKMRKPASLLSMGAQWT